MKTVNTNPSMIKYLINAKFLALFFVMVSSFSFAQIDKPYIDSSGQVEYSREVEKYSATIVVSEDLAYSSYDENITFEKIKSDYFGKLKNSNVDITKLKEDELAYTAMGYRKKGMVYQFETTSQEKFIELLSVGFSGVNVNEKYVHYKDLSSQQVGELSSKAIADAKTRAEIIAKSAGKKIGGILSLNNYKEESKRGFYSTRDLTDHIFSVSVRYELQ
ncbi:SIMPL domain-containing protein [Aureibaculum sp. 2210JD6-5]|uniref:SIMPL domain-containing protein n=1 Tax=Aureibaculum sp. 2210JD6-5 TaxID=3103957 RepID=UPI002AAEC453|nr:SIMPL domain-containing protein [Aureibaculum sp. 2210JD6-5]MDY7396559.1 SIMPL domain-containing protein [Aureibaculum sp. 2210JD6-5]